MTWRHKRGGYEQYRRDDEHARHRPSGIWRDYTGLAYCWCAWPVTYTKTLHTNPTVASQAASG